MEFDFNLWQQSLDGSLQFRAGDTFQPFNNNSTDPSIIRHFNIDVDRLLSYLKEHAQGCDLHLRDPYLLPDPSVGSSDIVDSPSALRRALLNFTRQRAED